MDIRDPYASQPLEAASLAIEEMSIRLRRCFHSDHPVTCQVKEYRCRKGHRIQPVEDSSMAFDHPAPVLYAAVAFDGHDESAKESLHRLRRRELRRDLVPAKDL